MAFVVTGFLRLMRVLGLRSSNERAEFVDKLAKVCLGSNSQP